jgi:ATP-dependent DNA helicase UvrD/PcrA
MPSTNRAIIASAGSGKTTGIVKEILANPDTRVLVTTFTLSNTAEIRSKFIELNGFVPEGVTIIPWFTFVLRELVRPYQNFFFRPARTQSLNLVSGRSDMYAPKSNKQRYYFGKGRDIYSDKISKFALNCNTKSGGKVISRLESMFDCIYIDEIQDLAGYDLELLLLFLSADFSLVFVGDHRQATLATNQSPKNKKYRYVGIIKLLKLWERKKLIDIEFKAISYRCRQEICDFADRLFPDDPAAESQNDVATDHDGIFIISKSDASRYVEEFSPQILRYSKVTKCDGLPAMNFRVSKGLTFDRVLIYPHKSVCDYLKSGDLRKLKEPQLLYVAATRAKQSVAFVMDDEVNVPEVKKFVFV